MNWSKIVTSRVFFSSLQARADRIQWLGGGERFRSFCAQLARSPALRESRHLHTEVAATTLDLARVNPHKERNRDARRAINLAHMSAGFARRAPSVRARWQLELLFKEWRAHSMTHSSSWQKTHAGHILIETGSVAASPPGCVQSLPFAPAERTSAERMPAKGLT